MKNIICFLIFSCLIFPGYCNQYQETVAAGKKIITGITQEDSLKEFGVPAKGNADFWYYNGPRPFYVYFPETVNKSTLFVFPYSYSTKVGVPFEIKAFVLYPNFHIDEVTEYVDWIITDKSKIEQNKNFFIPLQNGTTKILAAYRNITSNACTISMAPGVKDKNAKVKNLLAINIFPHKPSVRKGDDLTFVAFGTFFNPQVKKISVKNISRNVNWFIEDEAGVQEKQRRIYFRSSGKKTVFCKYRNIKSNPQEIMVQDNTLLYRETSYRDRIKNIRLLPDFANIGKGVEIDMKVIATNNNGKVEHVGAKSLWRIDDKKVINFVANRIIKSEREGIANVYVSLDDLHRSFSKILVTKELETGETDYSQAEDIPEETDLKKLTNNIKKTIQKLIPESAKIEHIVIKPARLTLALGHKAELTAEAVYSDNSTVDALPFVEWKSTDPATVTIEKGKLSTQAQGKTSVYAYREELKSNLSEVTVAEPELVSIALDPDKLKLEVDETAMLKTLGHYSDSSKKNIIDKVNWVIPDKNLLEIDETGRLRAKKKGTTNIYAHYGKIQSLPTTVKIFISFLKILKKIIGIFLMFCLGTYLFFRLLLKIKVTKLRKLILNDPSKFIESLYENSKKVLGTFGIPYLNTVPGLTYAETVEKKFSIDNNCFTQLTYNFYETRYSSHLISTRNAMHSLYGYNRFVEAIKKKSSGFLFKFGILLIRGYPFSI